jgi:predicted metalloprotease with PDZ domain
MASVQALESYLARQDIGDDIPCHYFRRDELHETVIHLYEPPCDRVLLEPALKKPDEALEWMSK